MILLGAAALVGCFVFASFDKKTLAQQKEEIAQAVTAKLDALRSEKDAACTASVNSEAQTRYQAWVAEEAAKPAPAVAGGKKTTKKAVKPGPHVDPLPQKTTPAPTDPKKDKMQGGTNVEEKKAKMEGTPTNTEAKKKKMGGGK